jgi:transposase InsO family protein
MTTYSLGGAKYFLIFIDDFSCFLGIYTIRSKDEVFGKYKEFKSLVGNQSKRKIKCIRVDGRGDYTSKAFQSFLIYHGISWQHIILYTPYQNGVDECYNRAIMEMAQFTLHSKEMKLTLLGK